MVAVHVPAATPVGISCVNVSVVGVVLMLAVVVAMLYTAVPCCRVIRHTTEPLPVVVSSTKLNFTEDPRGNDVAGDPALFSVWAVLLNAAWLTVNVAPLPAVTVNVAVPMLLLVSIAVIVWLPDRTAGIVA